MTKSISLVIAITTIWIASQAFATETTRHAEPNTQSGVDEIAANSTESSSDKSSEPLAETNDKSGSGSDSESASDTKDEKNPEQLTAVMAVEADQEYGAYLAGECLTCHAPSGGDGSIPLIHAKAKDYIASALLEYKNQQRSNEVMRGVTAALSNEEIAALATFFSEQ